MPTVPAGDGEEAPLQLHGTRTEPSALLKLQGTVRTRDGTVATQLMVDSGASGVGFVDPEFVKKVGGRICPSSRRIALADVTGAVLNGTSTVK